MTTGSHRVGSAVTEIDWKPPGIGHNRPPPDEIRVTLPTLHADQVRALDRRTGRFVVRCGRRWGKTVMGETMAADGAIKGQHVGWFAPTYKIASAAYYDLAEMLAPLKPKTNKTEGVIRLPTGGSIEVWTLEDDSAGRSRKYHKIVVDEGAFGKPNLTDIWEQSIEPTLLDYLGSAIVFSNTNGIDRRQFFWQICNQPEKGWTSYHAPSWKNPTVPSRLAGESYEQWLRRRQHAFAQLKRTRPPLVYAQEYDAEFVDWSGVAFFERAKLLNEFPVGTFRPVDLPAICDGVFAVVDTAAKTGKDNDGTAVAYFAKNSIPGLGPPLTVLDYDLAQMEGASLEVWLPTVFQQLQFWADRCKARMGVLGTWVEDKSTGMVLLQNAANRGWPAVAIDSKLTSMGKSERAIAASPYVYQHMVKLAQPAFDRVINYKGITENHLLTQVLGFRVGLKDMIDDDLLDCFCYGVVIGLGNSEGF